MTVIGIDDTDSRVRGMCTTYIAACVARELRHQGWAVNRLVLARLNPAVPYKTRGNAALAVHAECGTDLAFTVARRIIGEQAEIDDEDTNPGLVVAPGAPGDVPDPITSHSRSALWEHLAVRTVRDRLDRVGYRHTAWGSNRGLVGALAAIGAWESFDEWTYECIAYRSPERWGSDRAVDRATVFEAAAEAYPTVWDTVDRGEDTVVCVPRTPGPVLHGIRGDDRQAVERVSHAIDSEAVSFRETFVTNQGTDAHLQTTTLSDVTEATGVRLDGTVHDGPRTHEGGHVVVKLHTGDGTVDCIAYEPTKRFRDRVRLLKPGDRLTVCGQVSDGTLNLEKFAIRRLNRSEPAVPACPTCDRSMESAGRDQGYRCRPCGTSRSGKVTRPVERTIEPGWYEVPPCARRHVAKPLVRGGFDAPTHPER